MKKLINFAACLLVCSLSLMAADKVEITGAGASFPFPLYDKMFNAYHQETGVQVNYQAIGSGGGIRALQGKTVNFGATDAFMNDEKLAKMDGEVLHMPTCLGAVVSTYNIPGKPQVKLNADVLAKIFLGKINKWNDPAIQKLNDKVKLPNMSIVVVHRSDGSGTTFIFSDFLNKTSKDWADKVGAGKALNWPTGLGAKGNAGVAGFVRQIPGAIGYVEFIYALQNHMPVALIQNQKGNFVSPSLKSVSLAAATTIPDDTRVSITNTGADEGYPISSFTWLIFYKELSNSVDSKEKAQALAKLLDWMIHDGQRFANPLEYGSLPKGVVKQAESILKNLTYKGKAVK